MKRRIVAQTEGKTAFVPGAWKEDTDKIVNREEIKKHYETMSISGTIPAAEKDFVFVSPTANIPTHELALFEEDRKIRQGKSLFLIGDISSLDIPAADTHRSSEYAALQYFRWDAEELPIRENSVDMLWDRKGWLWYAARAGDPERFLDAIDQYHRLLKDDGCIVVDHIAGYEEMVGQMSFSQTMRALVLMFLAASGVKKIRPASVYEKSEAMQYEESTVDAMYALEMRQQRKIWDDIRKRFQISTEGEGPGRVLVMKKISQAEVSQS